MSYENRIALGNLVPTLGQFKVMDKIPQYQQCEVHNLVEAPAEVPEVLRHVVFNIERGQTLHETCLLYTSPSPRDVEESRMPSSA